MAIVRFRTTTANAMLEVAKADLDLGSGPCLIEFYTGAMAATPETAIGTQVKLGTLTGSDPCGSVAAKALTFSSVTQDAGADATGIATWARIKASDGTAIIDLDVSSPSGSGYIKINTTSIVEGGPITMTSLIIRLP